MLRQAPVPGLSVSVGVVAVGVEKNNPAGGILIGSRPVNVLMPVGPPTGRHQLSALAVALRDNCASCLVFAAELTANQIHIMHALVCVLCVRVCVCVGPADRWTACGDGGGMSRIPRVIWATARDSSAQRHK